MATDRNLAQLSPERPHPAADGGRCRDPQPNIRLSLGSLAEELGIKVSKSEGSKRLLEDCQQSWDRGDSQSMGHQQENMEEMGLDFLHTCSKCATWSSCGFPNKWNKGVGTGRIGTWTGRGFSVSAPCHWIPFPIWTTWLDQDFRRNPRTCSKD